MELQVEGNATFAATGGQPFDAAKPTVVFVHGAGMDHSVWALQTRYFAHRGRSVLALDLPGHGRSGGAAPESIPAIADWLTACLDAAGLETATLAGHSMGALTVLDCAARYPDRVAGLVLLGIGHAMPVHPDLLAAAEADDPLAFELVTSWAHGETGHIGGARMPGLWLLGGAERLLERSAPGLLYRDLKACAGYGDALERAAGLSCPVLLIVGRGDKMTPPKSAAKLAGAMKDARTILIEDSGHMMMLEKPDETLAALKSAVMAGS